jgi:hypothetical protein
MIIRWMQAVRELVALLERVEWLVFRLALLIAFSHEIYRFVASLFLNLAGH